MRTGASDDEIELLARELGRLVDNDVLAEVGDDFVRQLEAEVFVGQLAAPVDDSYLHLMAGVEKVRYFAELNAQIVFANLETEAHLLHFKRFGTLLVALQLLGPLVIVLAPVDYFGDRWASVGRNLYEIKLAFFSQAESLVLGQNAKLLPILVDDPQFGSLNGAIQAGRLIDTGSLLMCINLICFPV